MIVGISVADWSSQVVKNGGEPKQMMHTVLLNPLNLFKKLYFDFLSLYRKCSAGSDLYIVLYMAKYSKIRSQTLMQFDKLINLSI